MCSSLNRGIIPIIEKVKENLNENEAYELEEELIKKYGRRGIDENGILMNICNSVRPPIPNRPGKLHPMYGKNHTEETRERMRDFHRNNYENSIKNIKRLADLNSKIWSITTPTGEKLIIKNLNNWCKENNLDSSCMSKVLLGKRKQHKGYTA